MSSDEDEVSEEVAFFEMASKNVGPRLTTVCIAAGIDTCDKVLAQHGMSGETPSDPAVGGVLKKLQALDSSILLDMDGADAISIRLLHRKCIKNDGGTPPSKKAKIGGPAHAHAWFFHSDRGVSGALSVHAGA